MTEEEKFFHELLKETENVFFSSEIYEKSKNENWNFAICDSPIQKGRGIVFGLNWGGKDINAQRNYPVANKKRDWNFISHNRKYFDIFLNSDISQLNYSNLCFFRSHKIDMMTAKDWKLVVPLFEKYVDFINPPWTVMLGATGIKYLELNYLTNFKKEIVCGKTKRIFTYTGKLFDKYPFACVPHPQTRISKDNRTEAWRRAIKFNI